MHHFGEELHQPQMVWWWVIGVGVVTTLLLWIYDRLVRAEIGGLSDVNASLETPSSLNRWQPEILRVKLQRKSAGL